MEIFLADNDPSGHGEGPTFITSVVSVGSSFTVPICGEDLSAGDKITATATDTNGSTSEFAANFTLSVAR